MTAPPSGEIYEIVRPGQLRVGALRLGIAALRPDSAVFQLHVTDDLPIRRLPLTPGESVESDGWSLTLLEVSTADRGSARVLLGPVAG